MEYADLLPKVNEDPEHIIDDIRVFALDMDGTVYLGEQWIDGAVDFLARVRASGRKYIFLTNNSSKDAAAYVEKLEKMGLPVSREDILTSGQAMIWYLKKHFPGKRVFLLGNMTLKRDFAGAGILLDEEDPEVAVAAFDTSLTYAKLCRFCDLVRAGLPYLATHPDFNCPTQDGFVPDLGSFLELIRASAFRYPDRVIGKPNREITDYLMERLASSGMPDIERSRIAMVGDRLYTDIAAGVRGGLKTVLVLSGEADLAAAREAAKEGKEIPDLIFDSVKEIRFSEGRS